MLSEIKQVEDIIETIITLILASIIIAIVFGAFCFGNWVINSMIWKFNLYRKWMIEKKFGLWNLIRHPITCLNFKYDIDNYWNRLNFTLYRKFWYNI